MNTPPFSLVLPNPSLQRHNISLVIKDLQHCFCSSLVFFLFLFLFFPILVFLAHEVRCTTFWNIFPYGEQVLECAGLCTPPQKKTETCKSWHITFSWSACVVNMHGPSTDLLSTCEEQSHIVFQSRQWDFSHSDLYKQQSFLTSKCNHESHYSQPSIKEC